MATHILWHAKLVFEPGRPSMLYRGKSRGGRQAISGINFNTPDFFISEGWPDFSSKYGNHLNYIRSLVFQPRNAARGWPEGV